MFFFDDEENLDTISDSITSYILFCEDNVIPKKTVKIYSNTKPWVNVEMKKILTDKKKAFQEGDKRKQKELEKEFNFINAKCKKRIQR